MDSGFYPNKLELLVFKIKGNVLSHSWGFAPSCIYAYVPALCPTIKPVGVMNPFYTTNLVFYTSLMMLL